MLKKTFIIYHNIRDKRVNAHNMSFDTLSSVYRDSVKPIGSVLPRQVTNTTTTEESGRLLSSSSPLSSSATDITDASEETSGNPLISEIVRKTRNMSTSSSNIETNSPTTSTPERLVPQKRGLAAIPTYSGLFTVPRRSGLQREILTLYKNMLKAAEQKGHSQTVYNFKSEIRQEFKRNATVERKMITKIEWMLHRGKNKLEDLRDMKKDVKFSVMK
eukprot:Tbor_TRINITY_DN5236_c0_g1::TRINITY_DN5236_c0_g1_i1::g.16805::m.16805